MPSSERYERLQELGAGGMATVYEGRDVLLDRRVAIKVLHPELAKREALRSRFLREARIFARLKHPHIVDIYDVISEDDEVAMVMEFVEGCDLKEILQRQPRLIPPLAALVIEPVADALAYAHEQGVIHRDVKPANVLMGADGTVKLSDFGIAKATEEANLTKTGEFLGTPAYIAPEQAQGAEITPAVDQYALGVVLYQLVTGEQPFHAPNTMAILTRIVMGNYTDPRKISDNVDETLARIISRALKLDPAERFPNVHAFLSALAIYQAQIGAGRRRALLSGLVEDPAALDASVGAELSVGGLGGAASALLRPQTPSAPVEPMATTPTPQPIIKTEAASEPAPLATSSTIPRAPRFVHPEAAPAVDLTAQEAELDSLIRQQRALRQTRGPFIALILTLAALLGGAAWLMLKDPAPPAVATARPAPLKVIADAAVPADASKPPPDQGIAPAADAAPPVDAAPKAKPKVKQRPSRAKRARPKAAPKAAPAQGTLVVHCAPWAEVYVDGQKRGRTPPALRLELKTGAHQLELRNPGLDPVKETVQIQGGQTLKRKIRLRRSR